MNMPIASLCGKCNRFAVAVQQAQEFKAEVTRVLPLGLAAVMRDYRISLRQLARLCQCSPTYLSLLARGRAQPSPGFARRLRLAVGKLDRASREASPGEADA